MKKTGKAVFLFKRVFVKKWKSKKKKITKKLKSRSSEVVNDLLTYIKVANSNPRDRKGRED